MKVANQAADPERSTLTPPDLALVITKHHGNRLGFAVLLAFFRDRGRFPRTAGEIDPSVVEELARQLAVAAPPGFAPILAGRTAERHRAEIRALAGFREASVADAALLEGWLRGQDPSLPHGSRYAALSITGRKRPTPAAQHPPIAPAIGLGAQCRGLAGGDPFGRYRIRQRNPQLVDPTMVFGCRVQAPVSDIQPMPQIGNDAVFVDNPFAKTGDIHGQLARPVTGAVIPQRDGRIDRRAPDGQDLVNRGHTGGLTRS